MRLIQKTPVQITSPLRQKVWARITMLMTALVLSALFATTWAWGKSFFLTVRRDFGPQEKPQIEVAFRFEESFKLRVLAPKDLKSFVAQQIDLRRSWKEPRLGFNPMHFLRHGLNSTNLESDWLRRGADQEFRRELIPQAAGGQNRERMATLPVGPEKLILAPDDFRLVRETSFDPESLDKGKVFDVPGFNWWEDYSGYRIRDIELEPLPVGFYVVQAVQGGQIEGQVVLVVNDLVAQLQQSSGKGLVRAVDRAGRPVADAKVQMRKLDGSWRAEAVTDAHGEAQIENLQDPELITLVSTDKHGTAVIDSEFFPTAVIGADVYMYTDRPMLKRGERVNFRGVLRDKVKGEYEKHGVGQSVAVRILNAADQTPVTSGEFKVGEYGTFSGHLVLDTTQEGLFVLEAEVLRSRHRAEFRVKDYVKPLNFLTISSDQKALRAGEKLIARAKVQRYAGGTPSGVKGQAKLYRQRLSSPQFVEDAGLGETGSVVTYGGERPQAANEPNVPLLVAETPELEFDDNGELNIAIDVPKELQGPKNFDYSFSLRVMSVDADGNFASSSKSFLDVQSDVRVQARFTRPVIEASQKARLSLRCLDPGQDPYPQARGEVQLRLAKPTGGFADLKTEKFTCDQNGRAVIDIELRENGELIAQVTAKDAKGRSSTPVTVETISAVKGTEGGVARVSEPRIVTNSSNVQVGDKAKFLLLLPQGWGEKGGNEGRLHMTIAGQAIYRTSVHRVAGNAVWLEALAEKTFGTSMTASISWADPRAGWVERRATFRIIDVARLLKVEVKTAAGVAMPGGSTQVDLRVLDHAGQPVQAEVSVAVIDRAVLDLQPEIRPRVLDFFYPLDRLNLSSFLSSEFQGYGYGERMARLWKANHWFASLKNPRGDLLKEEDTAYWNGQLRTDAQGRAKAQFKLPGNQTIWKVIAIAVDPSSRMGESSAEFKANMPVQYVSGFPSYVRQGDQFKVNASVAAKSEASTADKYEVQYRLLAPEGLNIKPSLEVKGEVKRGAELRASAQVSVAADRPLGTAKLLTDFKLGSHQLNFESSVRVLHSGALIANDLDLDEQGRGALKGVHERSKIASLKVVMGGGLLATLEPSLSALSQYPYGCLEQTLSSTIPNFAAAGAYELMAGKSARGDSLLKKRLEALANGEAGLKRLATYRNNEGALAWWPAGPGDVNMSLLASLVVASSDLASLNELSNTYHWLTRQNLPEASGQGLALSYVKGMMVARNLVYAYGSDVTATLKLQAEYALKSESPLDRALLIMAMKRMGRDQKELPAIRAKLIEALKKDLNRELSGGPSSTQTRSQASLHPSGWTAFPGSDAITLAWIGRALNDADALPADGPIAQQLKRRLMQLFVGDGFGSTFSTSMTLLHSMWLIRGETEAAARLASQPMALPQLMIDGQLVPTRDTIARAHAGGLVLEVLNDSAALRRVKSTSKFEVKGGRASDSLRVVRSEWVVPSEVVAQDGRGGFQIQRRFFVLEKGNRREFNPAEAKLKTGDLIYVELELARRPPDPRRWRESRYWLVEAPIPAGFQLIDQDNEYLAAPYALPLKEASPTRREMGSDRVAFAFDFTRGWMERTGRVGFVMRAVYAGEFDAGVAKVVDFYDEAHRAHSGGARLRVD